MLNTTQCRCQVENRGFHRQCLNRTKYGDRCRKHQDTVCRLMVKDIMSLPSSCTAWSQSPIYDRKPEWQLRMFLDQVSKGLFNKEWADHSVADRICMVDALRTWQIRFFGTAPAQVEVDANPSHRDVMLLLQNIVQQIALMDVGARFRLTALMDKLDDELLDYSTIFRRTASNIADTLYDHGYKNLDDFFEEVFNGGSKTRTEWKEWSMDALPVSIYGRAQQFDKKLPESTRRADASYDVLMNQSLENVQFLNFSIDDKGHWLLKPSSQPPTYRSKSSSWGEIACRERQLASSGFTIKTTCLDPRTLTPFPPDQVFRTQKVFVQGYENFLAYIRALQEGLIDVRRHRILFTYLFQKDGSLLNDNLDVDILHFKYK